MISRNKSKTGSDLILNSQVAQGIAEIGDACAFTVIRDVYLGVRQFEEFLRRSGAARATLASRLKTLVRNGILCRSQYQDSPARFEYRLTKKGLDLYPMVLMMWNWQRKWGDLTLLPDALTHRVCGNDMHPILTCSACHGRCVPAEVTFKVGDNAQPAKEMESRSRRRPIQNARSRRSDTERRASVLDTVGDRWTSLVIAAAFFGLQRYDDMVHSLGIATNILADRLKLLVNIGILDRVPYRQKPVRYEYHLSDKGRDLYPQAIALHDWVNRWIVEPGREPLLLTHTPCGNPLVSEVVCSECGQPLTAFDVSYRFSDDRLADSGAA